MTARCSISAWLVAAGLILTNACASRSTYKPPQPSLPPAYKEIGDWKVAEPSDEAVRGKWWESLGDPTLNQLEEQLTVSNQTLKIAQAQFAQARALVRSARAGMYPQVGAGAALQAADQSATKAYAHDVDDTRYSDYLVHVDAAYELDVWGRVAKTVAASRASAQASAADLESVGVSLHAELAVDYFQARALETESRILDNTVANYTRALEFARNRQQGGAATSADVAAAETQLEATRAQAIDVRIRRAQFEHAIASLVGQPASTFALQPSMTDIAAPPVVPADLPSRVLERRPDIAAAERRMAAANAQVGVARSAFFPLIALTGSAGIEGAGLSTWLRTASAFWSVAPVVAMTVFDGGRRRGAVEQAQAVYARADAVYRDTLLTAFREVEDSLAALRLLREESIVQEAAVSAAGRFLEQAKNRYAGGIATYLEVIIAQNALLTNQRAAVNIHARQYAASVQLVKALGGGWGNARP